MTQQDETRTGKAEDYEYDLAHETDAATGNPTADLPRTLLPPTAMHVADDAGDYNYDAAHDRA